MRVLLRDAFHFVQFAAMTPIKRIKESTHSKVIATLDCWVQWLRISVYVAEMPFRPDVESMHSIFHSELTSRAGCRSRILGGCQHRATVFSILPVSQPNALVNGLIEMLSSHCDKAKPCAENCRCHQNEKRQNVFSLCRSFAKRYSNRNDWGVI
jgi:hypothetical protein